MKKSTFASYVFLGIVLLMSSRDTEAQLWKKIKNEVQSRAENKIVGKAGDATDKAIDHTADAVAGKNSPNVQPIPAPDPEGGGEVGATGNIADHSASEYKNYDFVAGDKIIFQPDLAAEPDAELPARFIVKKGNAEIQTYNGEKILHLQADGGATVAPLMNSENYLPEQFTLEFDMMFENEGRFAYTNYFNVTFRTPDENNYHQGELYTFTIENNSRVKFGDRNAGSQLLQNGLLKSVGTGNTWHHIAIYVRKNIGKAYIDQYRVFATNTLPPGAGKLDIKADRYGIKIKNLRLAEGGNDKYKKIVTDGKFITHGILFDVNKASIKAESMGTLNEIVQLMKAHPELSFEIDGHTDSDGNAEANVKLSQERAEAVKAKLEEMGIDGSRLTAKGLGASKPIDKNDTAEGKANNRRVEFVKM